MAQTTIQMDRRGVLVIPAAIRKRFGVQKGGLWLVDVVGDQVVLRPAMAVAVARYAPERQAEFLLNNAVDRADYERARAQVRKLGLDPDAIAHQPPPQLPPRL